MLEEHYQKDNYDLMQIENISKQISDLINSGDYSRIENLDKTLEEVNHNQINKTNKMDEITKEQTDFIEKFLKREKQIFYVTHNNQFFIYENTDFKLLNQNDLVIHIYTLINSTNNKDLIKAKFAIENKIIKEIKKSF